MEPLEPLLDLPLKGNTLLLTNVCFIAFPTFPELIFDAGPLRSCLNYMYCIAKHQLQKGEELVTAYMPAGSIRMLQY